MGKKKGGNRQSRGGSTGQPECTSGNVQSGSNQALSTGRDGPQSRRRRGRGRGVGVNGRDTPAAGSTELENFTQLGASAVVVSEIPVADSLTKQISQLEIDDAFSEGKQSEVQQADISKQDNKETKSVRKRPTSQNKPQKLQIQTTLKEVLPENQKRQIEFKIPERPGIGKIGRRIKLESNFFEVKIQNITISQYDVTFFDGKNNDKAPKELTRRVFQKFVDDNKKVFKFLPVYNGKKIMYVTTPLEFQGKKTFEVSYKENDEDRKFKITLQHSGFVDLSTLNNAIKGKKDSLIDLAAINALDLVLRHAPSLRYVTMGSKFFKSDGSVNIGGGKEMWHGYHQSVRPSRWKLFLNVDVSATTFVRNISVMEYMKEFFEESRRDIDISRPMTDRDKRAFSKEIKGLKIYTTYMDNKKRQYRVNGLVLPANKQNFSCEKNGKSSSITVQRYFSDEKNLLLSYPSLPCLHVGNIKRTIYLPMELCHMVKGQHTRKLTDFQTAKMIKQTCRKPIIRHQDIGKIVQESNYNKDKWAKAFGMKVKFEPELVEARILTPPGIIYEKTGNAMIPESGAWNMKGKKLYKGANIGSWAIIDFQHGKSTISRSTIDKFVNGLIGAANSMGIQMKEPSVNMKVNENMNAAKLIEKVLSQDKEIELLLVILHGITPFYGHLKTICDTDIGVKDISNLHIRKHLQENGLATQCIAAKNVSKCNAMTIAQLLLKINAKMGGVNKAIDTDNPITRPIKVFDEPVMFLGADVSHPGRGDTTRPSIAAVVGSIDEYPIRYATSVRAQTHRMEIIEDLLGIVKELLEQYKRNNKIRPAKIIMFRDGVSEGQFQQILEYELHAIQKACCEIEEGYQPGITFVVVQKRHHARFKSLGKTDKSGNCLAGTTIDEGVCHPTQFDYYQYSHAGIQGTSRPTHYHMLWDDNDFTADEMQALSFMLCHLYVRCTRSVSIPAPAYYAHLVAYRARYHLQKEEGSRSSQSGAQPEELYEGKITKKRLVELVRPSAAMVNRMYFV